MLTLYQHFQTEKKEIVPTLNKLTGSSSPFHAGSLLQEPTLTLSPTGWFEPAIEHHEKFFQISNRNLTVS